MTLLLTSIGFAVVVWFGKTAGRLGHGFTRSALWSVVGLSLFLAPLFGIPWLFDMLSREALVPDPFARWLSIRTSEVLAIGLPILVRYQILLKTSVAKLSVLREETNR